MRALFTVCRLCRAPVPGPRATRPELSRSECACCAPGNLAKGKRSGKKPMQQNIEFFALLKKPMEAIGKQIRMPGSYWAGNMTAAEKDTDYFWCASLPCARPRTSAH